MPGRQEIPGPCTAMMDMRAVPLITAGPAITAARRPMAITTVAVATTSPSMAGSLITGVESQRRAQVLVAFLIGGNLRMEAAANKKRGPQGPVQLAGDAARLT